MSQQLLLEPVLPPVDSLHEGNVWRFEIEGHPEPQGSMKPLISKTTGFPMLKATNETALKRWRKLITKTAYANRPEWLMAPLDQPVFVSLTFVRERSPHDYLANGYSLRKGAPRHPATTPDIDKLTRAMLDGLTGVAFINDSRVVSCMATKRFATLGETERVIVEIVAL